MTTNHSAQTNNGDVAYRRPIALWWLIAALVVQGVGGLGGGVVFLLDTTGGLMGVSTETLTGTPVDTYLLPGLLLAIPLGLIPLLDCWALIWPREYRWAQPLQHATGFHIAWLLALAIGVGLVIWILVEYLLIGYQWLQAVFGLLGVLIVILTLLPSVRRHYARNTKGRRDQTQTDSSTTTRKGEHDD